MFLNMNDSILLEFYKDDEVEGDSGMEMPENEVGKKTGKERQSLNS